MVVNLPGFDGPQRDIGECYDKGKRFWGVQNGGVPDDTMHLATLKHLDRILKAKGRPLRISQESRNDSVCSSAAEAGPCLGLEMSPFNFMSFTNPQRPDSVAVSLR